MREKSVSCHTSRTDSNAGVFGAAMDGAAAAVPASSVDPAARERWMESYRSFWASQGKEVPACKVRWQTEPIDVFALYCEVQKLGGSGTVREKNLWRSVGDAFNPPSASHVLAVRGRLQR